MFRCDTEKIRRKNMLNIIPKPNYIAVTGAERPYSEKDIRTVRSDLLGDEEYYLEITKEKIEITAKTEKGFFYARQTLKQLSFLKEAVPCLYIKDKPRYPYRAFMIDSARHMQTVDEIKTYIEAAALFKFNVFHWHLCDDQGFRIESEEFPQLNAHASWRNGHGFGSKNTDRYGGYYTKAQIKEVVEFCSERFIDVIPEIDMPGHTIAILSSYPSLSCRKKEIPVETRPGVHKDIMCAGREETFDFCFKLLDEVSTLFPYEYFHIGGDEAPKDRWNECPDCQRRIREENLKDAEQLQGYFVNRIVKHMQEKGKKCIAWNESLNSGMLDKDVVVADWMDKENRSQKRANAGGKIIVEDFFSYYLDYPYGMTPLEKTYRFDPNLEGLDETGKSNVIGVETPIWTEFVEDFDRLCYMCFPRMMAVSEIGWTDAARKNYQSFEERAEKMRALLAETGVSMALRERWNPKGIDRLHDLINHYKRFLTKEGIRQLLKIDEE